MADVLPNGPSSATPRLLFFCVVGPLGWLGHLGQEAGNNLIGHLLKDAMHLPL
jgi:hypothetical protein